MLAYFGTDVDRGKGAVGVDVDGVEGIGMEWGDEKRCLSLLKIDPPGNVVEEVGVNEFFAGVPNVMVLLVDDGVLVRVVVVCSKARWGGEEVGEGEEVGSKRSEEGGGRQQGGGGDGGDGSFDDRRGNVLNRDIFKINNFTQELKLHPVVLSEWGEEAIKFCLGEADDVGGCLFTKLFKVELSCSTKGFKGGLQGRRGWELDDIGVWVNRMGLKGVGVNEKDVGVSGRSGVDGRGSGSKKRKTRDNELGAGSNGGRPGYSGGLGVAEILEAGASRTWVIPCIVGTVGDVVDNLKGSGGVGLIDFIQVRPGGDREGRGQH